MSGNDKKKAPPAPQLAREVINLESSSDEDDDVVLLETVRKKPKIQHKSSAKDAGDGSDDSDDSSLVILPPTNKASSKSDSSSASADKNPLSNQTNNSSKTKAASRKKPPPPAATETASSASTSRKTASNTKSSTSRFSKDFAFSDSEDSDDDDLLLSTKPTFETREQIKERQKREKERQKEREKLARAKKRQEEKAARERQKQREKEEKRQQNQAHAQATGKFKHDEIAILMDPKLHEDDPLGLVQKLSDDFLVHSYPSATSIAPGTIQFVRRDFLKGGAKDAVASLDAKDKDGYEHIHQLVLVIEPEVFIPLLQREDHEEDDDYPKLESWLSSIKAKWRKAWKTASHEEPRMLLILRDLETALDDMWTQYRRQHRGELSLPRKLELDDAMRWLLVQFQVECMLCKNNNLIQLTLHKMARALSDKPYATQVTELECIKKIKAGPGAASDDPVDRARDVWLRQLQQVPRLSQGMAENVVLRYPTCQALWQRYRELLQNEDVDEGIEDCGSLLADILNGGRSSQQKLSQAVFRIMMSDDPNEMIL